MNGPLRMSFASLVKDVQSSRPAQAPLSFKDLRDLSSQIKGSGCMVKRCQKPALWSITEHIRMILWNFLALPQCWNIYAPHQIVEKTRYDQILFCRPLLHQDSDSDSRYDFGEEYVFFHISSFHFYQLYLIWFEGTMADKRYCLIFVRLAASESYHLHLRSVWWMILDISPAIKHLERRYIYLYLYLYFYFMYIHMYIFHFYSICVLDTRRFCGDITWHTWNSHCEISLEHLMVHAVLRLGPKEIVIVLIATSLNLWKNILYPEDSYKISYVNPQSWISHFGFYHREQWRCAKTPGKKCWGPCHGLVPSLWDFAQNYSLQIELRNQNWRGTFYLLD